MSAENERTACQDSRTRGRFAGKQTDCQNNIKQFTEGFNIKFDLLETKKLERAVNILDEADIKFQQATQLYDQLTVVEQKERISDEYQKALKTLNEASVKYKEAHTMVFEVYKAKADAFWKKMTKVSHRASGMDKARYYEGKHLKVITGD